MRKVGTVRSGAAIAAMDKEERWFIRILREHIKCGFPVTRDAVRRMLFPKDEWVRLFGTFECYKRAAGLRRKARHFQ